MLGVFVGWFVCLGPVERTVNNFPFSWGKGEPCIVSKNQIIAPEFISKKPLNFLMAIIKRQVLSALTISVLKGKLKSFLRTS